jgi:hypothetical protein
VRRDELGEVGNHLFLDALGLEQQERTAIVPASGKKRRTASRTA